MARTIETVGKLEKHEPSGQFYNWYDPKTLEKLTIWPENGNEVQPFLSSVDNGWLATGLLLAARAEPRAGREADAIREDMDFGCYYNEAEGQGGQIRGGFWDEDFGDPAGVTGRLLRHGRRTSGTPATTTAPSTPSRGWRRTSASRPGRSRRSTTSARSAPSPATPATGRWTEAKPTRRVEDLRGRRRLRGRPATTEA